MPQQVSGQYDHRCAMYFGDASTSVQLDNGKVTPRVLSQNVHAIRDLLGASHLVFLRQTHGTNAVYVSPDYQFAHQIEIPHEEGDIILCNRPLVGIGVMTADCLPVILYDPIHHAAAIVHAGWRGSVSGVLERALARMHHRFATDSADVHVYFGPSAHPCCYAVGKDFKEHVREKGHAYSNVFVHRDGRIFFDLPLFNVYRLRDLGVPDRNIDRRYMVCTICNHAFCSTRRNGGATGRQPSIVMLRLQK